MRGMRSRYATEIRNLQQEALALSMLRQAGARTRRRRRRQDVSGRRDGDYAEWGASLKVRHLERAVGARSL